MQNPDSLTQRLMRSALGVAADNLGPVLELYRPYVDGLENLPADGRFLLVGNHTQAGFPEAVLPAYYIRHHLGRQLRPLADRQFGKMGGPQADLLAAFGAVVGSPESASQLMRENRPILVFPGGGREIGKFRGEQYQLRWHNRYGFARVAIAHDYPIVTAALVGGDDLYTPLTSRDGLYGRASTWITERLTGRSDMAMPLIRGIGPTLIAQPQRMYLRFGPVVDTTKPADVTEAAWVTTVKDRVQAQLESELAALQRLRESDPYRSLNPLSWTSALMPTA
ncbi:lysophospholipid acyltransferase family protein [Mycolicibacterium brumae]|uniref:Glycerol acyltransferase n=1 Tax=Mycolicibacterium brumae TaxID=85968 RepID=A0A2G5PGU9_9MYCO|nr:lysophospholipid acyltransferase family protein [Mycolicibacterium brumae]MCV7194349.1 1-acyl-sn-glycerol-3-phosphate acyltransferase [Mycolicibacterium brumae]PIB77253.1 glycerol acyltransferase [Mycolicibacterium brumae]RWA15501.1 hypothetical protein MBRU_10650 [Mycolicibacterium brumae DSM 44177]UWW10614.1 1-acyl-sn-glycerol-3-phosphate acyltransferase [Mycolicibacterium brumae]